MLDTLLFSWDIGRTYKNRLKIRTVRTQETRELFYNLLEKSLNLPQILLYKVNTKDRPDLTVLDEGEIGGVLKINRKQLEVYGVLVG